MSKRDLYHYKGRECGQGYEDDQCVDCKWVMGLRIGLIACGKGMLDAKEDQHIFMLGKK